MKRSPESDPFEDEIRQALVREAAEPAPERLVARVAGSRRRVEPASAWMNRLRPRLGGRSASAPQLGFGLVALVGVLVVGAVLLRGTGPGPAVAGHSPVTVASGRPSEAPSTPSSATPTAVPTAVPTPPTSSSPAVPASPPVGGPIGGPIPAGFQPQSVTFVSADEGWLLGSATCSGKPCTAIVRTTDGGRTWASIPAPGTTLNVAPEGAADGVSGLRFASSLDGWAFGPDLWATHDGGATWHKVGLPGATADTGVWALEASAGSVHAAVVGIGSGIALATSATDSDAWAMSTTSVAFGAGPVPSVQLVLQDTTGWLVENDRTVIAGARLVNGAWKPWNPPCLETNGPATLAAISATELVVACDEGVWSTPTGVHVLISSDAGSSFAEVARPGAGVAILAATTGAIVLAGDGLVASFDRGASWGAVASTGGSVTSLGFTTPTQGAAIQSTDSAGHSQLLMTRDGGHTWSPVAVAGP
jgi:photosystem II stability/assembly factor-like uncharacterized protein